VELETNNKVVPLPFDWLKKRDPVTGQLSPLQVFRVGQAVMASDRVDPSTNPYANAGPISATPASMAVGGRTPGAGLAWGATPNPYAGAMGGRTPAPGLAYGTTPNPYAAMGNRTPAAALGWGTTPNPYAAAMAVSRRRRGCFRVLTIV
jgi:transcription elongation factor SPT5